MRLGKHTLETPEKNAQFIFFKEKGVHFTVEYAQRTETCLSTFFAIFPMFAPGLMQDDGKQQQLEGEKKEERFKELQKRRRDRAKKCRPSTSSADALVAAPPPTIQRLSSGSAQLRANEGAKI